MAFQFTPLKQLPSTASQSSSPLGVSRREFHLSFSYMIPVYDRGEYLLKLLPPSGWSFEPTQIELNIDGETDPCTLNQDLNFVFKGFGLAGRVRVNFSRQR